MTCSFQVTCVRTYKRVTNGDCDEYFKPKLANRISHQALTQKIDISDSRAVVRYVERYDL